MTLPWLRRTVVCLCLLATAAEAQNLRFAAVPRDMIKQRLELVSGKNSERKQRLESLFKEAGCRGEALREQEVRATSQPNVICTLRGESDSVIVVGAHYDTVPDSRGAADNWSGAALLPTFFQGLRGLGPRHTFVFVGFAAEEKGLVGSQTYVEQLSAELKAKMRAMVNVDTLGLGPTKVWASRADQELLGLLAGIAGALETPLEAVNADKVAAADSFPFDEAGIPSITIHSITDRTLGILHTHRDNLKQIRFDDYYNTYRLLSAYLTLLDQRLAKPAAGSQTTEP